MMNSIMSLLKRSRCNRGRHRYQKSWARRVCNWCGLDEVYLYENGKTTWTRNRWS